jgi:hypothetical protein
MNPRLPFPHALAPLAARISKACQLAQRMGIEIVSGTYGSLERGHMCPIGALYWAEGLELNEGLLTGEDDFVSGFDGDDNDVSSDYGKLGRAFRRRFCPVSPWA